MAGRASGPSYETLAVELKKGTLHAAYLLWGDERFLTARAEEEIIRVALEGAAPDAWNLVRYDGSSTALGEALASAGELPMLTSRRVVVYRGLIVRDARGAVKLPAKKAERDALRAYLDAPNPSTVLILTGEGVDQRQRFLTGARHLKIYGMRAPTPERLTRWIAGKAASCGFSITPEGVVELMERAGPSMTALSVEIEKLGIYADEGASAGPEEVVALAEGSGGASVYDVSDAIAGGGVVEAVVALRRVLELHTDGATRILTELRRSVGLWLRIRDGLDAGGGPQALAGSLKLPPFVVRRNVEGARRFDRHRLVELLSRVVDVERHLKLGGRFSETEIELLVLELASGRATARV